MNAFLQSLHEKSLFFPIYCKVLITVLDMVDPFFLFISNYFRNFSNLFTVKFQRTTALKTHTHTHLYIYAHVHVYTCTYIHAYICIWIYTHICSTNRHSTTVGCIYNLICTCVYTCVCVEIEIKRKRGAMGQIWGRRE